MRAYVLAGFLTALAGCSVLVPIPGPPPGTCEGVFQPGTPIEWAGTGTLEDFALEDPDDPIPPGRGQIFVGTPADGLVEAVFPREEGIDESRVACVVTREQGRRVSYEGHVPDGWEPP